MTTPGTTFGHWTVMDQAPSRGQGVARVKARCICGRVKELDFHSIKTGRSKSCGCRQKFRVQISEGDRFGGLTVLSDLSKQGDKHRKIKVRCDCGVVKTVLLGNLTSGRQTSCGCLGGRFTHKMSNSPEYSSWRAMKGRCSNPKHIGWENYGGRGVKVCPEWDSFEQFLADMGPRPRGHTLDRIDPNGNYDPQNCRWATMREQGSNKRDTIHLSKDGKTQTIMTWAQETGIPVEVIRRRIYRGWTHHRALTQAYRKPRRH